MIKLLQRILVGINARRRRFCAWAVVLLLALTAAAQNTRYWEQSKFEEFEKGTAKGVSIRSDGVLELAPAFRQIGTTASTYLWSVASDAQGNLYAAAGTPARVYRITPQGEVSVIFAAPELQVQALAADRSGAIYAATSPDGRVYRITRTPGSADATPVPKSAPADAKTAATAAEKPPAASGRVDPNYTSQVYFDPKTKYIWALALDPQGRLHVATGDHGEIYRVDKDGSGSVFFKSDEAHIRALALDRDGNLIAGSDGSGLVYRITPAGQGFVLYGAAKKEITALALDAQGNIYASAVGERRPAPPAPGITAHPVTVTPPAMTPPGAARPPTAGPVAPTAAAPALPLPGLGAFGSEIYRIAPDGSPKRIWSSREDLVYALTFDRNGRLIAGTGNKGKIYAVDNNGRFSDLPKASANQVTGFAPARDGGIYTICSNLGKVFLMEESAQREGTFDSDVFDARIFSRWGRAEMFGQGTVDLYARSGNVDNPDRNWSPWHKIDLAGASETGVPSARYVQWRAVLRSGSPAPRLSRVQLNYLSKNVAPEVDEVTVVVGGRANSTTPTVGPAHPIGPVYTIGPAAPAPAGPAPAPPRPDGGVPGHGNIFVRWAAHDDNGDQLSFSIYYRADGDRRWLLLKDEISERTYTFDPTLLPDGGYTLRVVASDAPSHAPSEALTGWKDSPHFEVDTTPPGISNLKARLEGDGLRISFTAGDSFSIIQRAEYSVDAGHWQVVTPVGEISDARSENYDFFVPLAASQQTQALPWTEPEASGQTPAAPKRTAPGRGKGRAAPPASAAPEEHIVVIRVYDRADNVVTAKTVVK